MAEEKLPSADEQIRLAREQFESAQDFSVAVEEEFAILDPETLSLTDGFEELKAVAQGTELEPHLVGELIASEVEIRTGRCDTFAEVVARIPERRAQLRELADKLGVTLGATGTHPWSPWQEQRIIDTPLSAPGRAAPLRGLAEQLVRPARPCRDPRPRPSGTGL